MEKSFCKTCLAKNLPDVVEPCLSCNDKSNWKSIKCSMPKFYKKLDVKLLQGDSGEFITRFNEAEANL